MTENKELVLVFVGIDDWDRPVFVNESGQYYGSVEKLFDYDTSSGVVLDYYSGHSQTVVHTEIVYFGSHFGCEPYGSSLPLSTNIILKGV